MRLTSVSGRAQLVQGQTVSDVATVSEQRFGPSLPALFERWEEFRAWAARREDHPTTGTYEPERADPVSPNPSQVFAVGLNYRAHALESGAALPEVPLVFTKFASCIAPAFTDVGVFTPQVDWEIEVAVVIGHGGYRIAAADAWDHIAGVTAAQDFSARDTQFASKSNPQFSLGKSYPAFLPIGPQLVTPDEYADPDAIALSCSVNGVLRQSSSTADLIFSVPQIVEYVSGIAALRPGDVILTGTPAGVGMGLTPPVYLAPGDVVLSSVDLVGEMRQHCVAAH